MWHEVIKASLPYFTATDIVRFSASCKCAQQLVADQLTAGNRHLARRWLLSAVQQAASCRYGKLSSDEAIEYEKASKLACWLLKSAAVLPEMMAQDSMQYLSVPNVPQTMCKLLLEAGVRLGYADLVATAQKRVDGLHNWVEACCSMGLSMDLQPSVIAACCSNIQLMEQHSWTLTADNIAGHLHLAINALSSHNSQHHYRFRESLITFSKLLDVSLSRDLHSTLTAQTVLQLLYSAIIVSTTRDLPDQGRSNRRSWMWSLSAMLEGVADPQNVDETAVTQLLTVAIRQRLAWEHMWHLLKLSAVPQLSSAAVAGLLLEEFSSMTVHEVEPAPAEVIRLFELPAAQHIPPDACARLFAALIMAGDKVVGMNRCWTWLPSAFYHNTLEQLPGIRRLSPAVIVQLLQQTIEMCIAHGLQYETVDAHVKCLCSLPSAVDIAVGDLQRLMKIATAADLQDPVLKVLMQLPAAYTLKSVENS